MLTKLARDFRIDRDWYKLNSHMHMISAAPSQNAVDAVLVGFINNIGMKMGVDYALYACDLSQSPNAAPESRGG